MIKLTRALLMAAAVFGILVALAGLAVTLGGLTVVLPEIGIVAGGPLFLILGLFFTFAALWLRRLLAPRGAFR